MSILNLYEPRKYKMGVKARIKWWIRRAKFTWQRAHWGFSAYDTWEMDYYLAELIADMLLYKAKFDASYFNGMTPEETQQWLIDTAALFKEYGREENETPAYKAYKASVIRTKNEDGSITVESDDELAKAWREDEKRRYEDRMNKLRLGFDRLSEKFSELWD